MTVRTGEQAIAVALAQKHNTPGTCQANVHEWFAAPAVGDVDKDGDADAVDGWESEPSKYRHPGDRNPPPCVPIAFSGGSHGFGHRAMTGLHHGNVRSTDMLDNHYSAGNTGTVHALTTSDAIAIIERSMGVKYLGWSETISGQLIPDFTQKPGTPPAPQTRGLRVDRSLRSLRKVRAKRKNPAIKAALTAAIVALRSIPRHAKKS